MNARQIIEGETPKAALRRAKPANQDWESAEDIVARCGVSLVGRRIDTEPYGDYPGGIAVVTRLEPDPEEPEIVFEIEHPTYGSIGVFSHEICSLDV